MTFHAPSSVPCDDSMSVVTDASDRSDGGLILNMHDLETDLNGLFACQLCPKKFQQAHLFERHLILNHRVKTYKCKICDGEFLNRQLLKEHCEKNHQEERVPCLLCKKTFTTKSSLRLHHDAIHKGIRYRCNVCDKSFGQLGSLRRHINTIHNGDASSSYPPVVTKGSTKDGKGQQQPEKVEQQQKKSVQQSKKREIIIKTKVASMPKLRIVSVKNINVPWKPTIKKLATSFGTGTPTYAPRKTQQPPNKPLQAPGQKSKATRELLNSSSWDGENNASIGNKRQLDFSNEGHYAGYQMPMTKRMSFDHDGGATRKDSMQWMVGPSDYHAIAILASMRS